MRSLLFLLIFGLCGVGVLLALGTWQVRRMGVKQEIIARIDARMLAPAVELPADPAPARDKYLAVSVTGTMLPGEIDVLTSYGFSGAGYRIVAPYELSDGRRIMVDRGYVPTSQKQTTRSTGEMPVTGNLHWPIETDGFTPVPDIDKNIWFAREVADMARVLDTDPVLIVARNRTDPGITPVPVNSSSVPNDHLNYAITWFSLAAIWAAMSAYFLWRSRTNAESKSI
ncbi:MAG: cytochrome oxidase biogenesis protein Surf1, facilitates heme A insertion [Rhodobacteraceae bacterium]|nr:MAG: cytochrome oxidase biogenesis protein Surf1, facilitates heme A insertion [Paracoccaceae bacterium]